MSERLFIRYEGGSEDKAPVDIECNAEMNFEPIADPKAVKINGINHPPQTIGDLVGIINDPENWHISRYLRRN